MLRRGSPADQQSLVHSAQLEVEQDARVPFVKKASEANVAEARAASLKKAGRAAKDSRTQTEAEMAAATSIEMPIGAPAVWRCFEKARVASIRALADMDMSLREGQTEDLLYEELARGRSLPDI
mmetsp:Transcript_19045/g.45708  ORF Transcript_19045/g.45708 Transcript_19045/m.45708 type:complete len:124 (+) Transcript_19045:687-1058(+)